MRRHTTSQPSHRRDDLAAARARAIDALEALRRRIDRYTHTEDDRLVPAWPGALHDQLERAIAVVNGDLSFHIRNRVRRAPAGTLATSETIVEALASQLLILHQSASSPGGTVLYRDDVERVLTLCDELRRLPVSSDDPVADAPSCEIVTRVNRGVTA